MVLYCQSGMQSALLIIHQSDVIRCQTSTQRDVYLGYFVIPNQLNVSVGKPTKPALASLTQVMVLDTVGLPSESVSIILSVDWLLDRSRHKYPTSDIRIYFSRFRTAINVLGDSIGAGIVDHLSKVKLEIRRLATFI